MKIGKIISLLLVAGLLSGCGKNFSDIHLAQQNEGCEEASETRHDILVKKPVIYIYGYNDKKISVNLELEGELTASYPKYDDGWHVTAKTDGTLESIDKKNTYPYLYWEGKLEDVTFDFNKGFCFKGSDTGAKLNEILKNIGLNDKERADFITYWLPEMQDNEYNVISFQTKPYTSKAKLDIMPKPKSVTRVFMAWYAADDFVKMDEQKFSKCPRDGMYAIEWGGCEVNSESFTPLYNGENTENKEEEVSSETEKINKYMELSIEENQAKQQKYLDEIRYSQSAVYYKMLGMSTVPTSSVPTNVMPQKQVGTHPYTDSQGNKAVFTDDEWNRLKNVWSWTGHPEDMIRKHPVGDLYALLGK